MKKNDNTSTNEEERYNPPAFIASESGSNGSWYFSNNDRVFLRMPVISGTPSATLATFFWINTASRSGSKRKLA